MTSKNQSHGAAALLQSHFATADGIALLFAPYVEVVIHDLSTQLVAHIANPMSHRRPGDSSQL
ncbi:MAG: PAS domain-containing protein, partial [Sphingopyxis sp.]